MAPKKVLAVKVIRKANSVSNADNMSAHIPTKSSSRCCYSSVSAIDGMEGHEFEHFCASVLRKVGFSDVSVTPGSGDQGVDVLATKDGIKYAIQCKNYASALSNTPVQEVSAGKQFYGCHVGVVMTNSTFTPGAIQLANATNVLLWDRKKLEELISQAGGLLSLGIQPEYNNFESSINDSFNKDDENKNFFKDGDCDESIADPITISKPRHPRPIMRFWSTLCFCWSAICILIFTLGLATSNREIMTMGLGEGLFFLVIAIMFSIFAKSKKADPYIHLFGIQIKKPLFVFICIIIAYATFLISAGAGGLLKYQNTQSPTETQNKTAITAEQ